MSIISIPTPSSAYDGALVLSNTSTAPGIMSCFDINNSLSLKGRISCLVDVVCSFNVYQQTLLITSISLSVLSIFSDLVLAFCINNAYSKCAVTMLHFYDMDLSAVNMANHSLLYQAAKQGDVTLLSFLSEVEDLTQYREINSENLPRRAVNKIEYIYQLLMGGGSEKLSVHIAAENHHYRFIEYLYSMNYDLWIRDEIDGNTALHTAAKAGDLQMVEYLRQLPDCPDDLSNAAGKSPFILAVEAGKLSVVQALYADVLRNYDDEAAFVLSAMKTAAEHGRVNVLKWLDSQEPSILSNSEDTGASISHAAANFGQLGVIKWLHQVPNYDLRALDMNGASILHFAANSGNLPLLNYLIEELHIDPSVSDCNHWTPLHNAVQRGHLDIVKKLIQSYGVAANLEADGRVTPFILAVQNAKIDIIEWLSTRESVDVNAGHVLHYAAKNGLRTVVACLGALPGFTSVNTLDTLGRSPLHCAVEFRSLDGVQALCELEGIDLSSQNNDDQTALEIAEEMELTEIAAYLRTRLS